MLPLSFREYVEAIGGQNSLQDSYNQYVTNSSFPYTLELESSDEISDYLNAVYNTIVVKDIMTRQKIQDVTMLESVIRFAADNIGNILSTKRIADLMTAEGRKIDQKTVEKYMHALCETFFLYEAKRYNIKGKQLLKSLSKYYLVDIGLRRMLLGSRGFDVGRVLENEVYLEPPSPSQPGVCRQKRPGRGGFCNHQYRRACLLPSSRHRQGFRNAGA